MYVKGKEPLCIMCGKKLDYITATIYYEYYTQAFCDKCYKRTILKEYEGIMCGQQE